MPAPDHALLAPSPDDDLAARMADRLRLLYTVTAPSAEPVEARLHRALALTTTLLGLELGVLSRVRGDLYTVAAVHSTGPVLAAGDTFPLGDTYCALTLGHDDVFAVDHMACSAHCGHPCYGVFGLESYIGVPVRAGGETVGTLCFSGTRPTAPFTEADRDLLRVLTTWIGGTMEQQAAEREAAEQTALVQGFYDASPLTMGIVEFAGTPERPDLLFRSCNATVAALLGRTPDEVRGQCALALGVDQESLAIRYALCVRAEATGKPATGEYETQTPSGSRLVASTIALITPATTDAPARFSFVTVDVTDRRQAQEALVESERRASALSRATFEGIVFTRDGVMMDANAQFAALLGLDGPAAGMHALAIVAPESETLVARMIGENRPEVYEARLQRRDGTRFWAEVQGQTIPYSDGEPARVTAIRDISRRKAAEAQIHFQADVLAHVSDAVVALDLDGCVTYWNAGAERLHGLAAATVVGRPFATVVRYALPDAPEGAPPAALVDAGDLAGDLVYESPGGGRRTVSVSASTLRDGDGAERGVLAVLRDVTPEREMAVRMAHQALHDALTGLPNRVHFRQRVERALRAGAPFGVLYVDLDHFKTVNDTLGHDAGDRLLLDVAVRLQAAAGPGAAVARLGGDEFAVAVPGDARAARRVGRRILAALRRPVEVGRREVTPGASIGLVAHAERYDAPEALLRDADTAMYRAKHGGRGRVVVFDDAMHRAVAERFALEHDLRAGLRAGQFCIRLQPIVDLEDGAVAGFEALARWEHPTRGLLGPAEFVALAEELGLIAEIDAAVLEATCGEVARWARESGVAVGDLLTMVNVNCSDQTFLAADLAERALASATAAGIPPACLTLELTERALVDPDVVGGVAAAIRASGLKLCVDDFGAGYSSLGLLHRLPVDGLKIDRSFVTDLGTSAAAEAVVRAVVQFSADLGLRTVAEGIETPAQLASLRAMGCRYGQGFLFAPPVAPDVARNMLTAAPWAAQWPFAA